MDELFSDGYKIPENFVKTSAAHEATPGKLNLRSAPAAQPQINPQTTAFCHKLEISDPMSIIMEAKGHSTTASSPASQSHEWTFVDESERNVTLTSDNPNEISCLSDEDESGDRTADSDVGKGTVGSGCEKSTDSDNGETSNADLSSAKIASDDEPATVASSTSKKTFKRRNQAIYANNDDDEA